MVPNITTSAPTGPLPDEPPKPPSGPTREKCSSLSGSCSKCYAASCRYCELGPQAWQGGQDPAESALAQTRNLDYACSIFRCEDLRLYRPGTQYSATVPIDGCSSVVQRPIAAPSTTPAAQSTASSADSGKAGIDKHETQGLEFLDSWTEFHWLAIVLPIAVLVVIACGTWCRYRPPSCCRRKSSRVRVAPADHDGQGASNWDYTRAGQLKMSDIDATARALTEAEEADSKVKLGGFSRRWIVFGVQNELHQPQLRRLGELLERHPTAFLSFHEDWRRADDASIQALAVLLKRRNRTKVQGATSDGFSSLRLPLSTSMAIGELVMEALSSGAHTEVDTLTFEPPDRLKGTAVSVNLSQLRLSSVELNLNRQLLNNLGCAAACAFMRPWASRLQAVRLLDCGLGDEGAAVVARLLTGKPGDALSASVPPAPALRELCLSSNLIGDRGMHAIAESLPVCDSLQRLLLDRNRIGPTGAKALAFRLPRSSIREVVLGSHLGGNPLGEDGVEALAATLDDKLPRAAADRAVRLQGLALEACGVGERGAKALASNLPKSELAFLSLARGDVGDTGAKAVLDTAPLGLASLDLAGNNLTDASASPVADALYRVPGLAVSIAYNQLSSSMRALLSDEHGGRIRV
mmetsp:Transcript_126788/g.253504  ORF Transcript_126788/g.253504 Transcript_126788/m.253504 type:complete len:636 (+) Transcript_126788:45-1952(+)